MWSCEGRERGKCGVVRGGRRRVGYEGRRERERRCESRGCLEGGEEGRGESKMHENSSISNTCSPNAVIVTSELTPF